MNHNPTPNEMDLIRDGLAQFNAAHVGDDGHTPLCLVEHDTNGNAIAGLLGGTYWGWLYVDILWVHQAHRKQGLGTKLLQAAEQEAARRGCHHVHVDTMSWQAPAFYQKQGYEILATLPDIPHGNQKYLMIKEI